MTTSTSPFADRADDRDAAPQFVLPLVIRVERDEPPLHTDALETAARAVLTLLSDPRTTDPAGEWFELVEAWQDARIRKVVRRARGGEWRKAGTLPGITVTGASAEVRVFPPVPLDGWPKELAKLQVSGLELTDRPSADQSGAEPAELAPPAPAQTPAPAPGTPVLWFNPEVTMSTGKSMAQAGHGAQLGWWSLTPEQQAEWRGAGFPLTVRTATPAQWAVLAASPLPMVRDAGFTEVAPGSSTVIADLRAVAGRSDAN
jgi:hypothetical protein